MRLSANDKTTRKYTAQNGGICSRFFGRLFWTLRLVVFDLPLLVLFALFVATVVVHKLHDEYLHPQLQLMVFKEENRQFTDTTYYHRVCDVDDFSAESPEELMIEDDFTAMDSMHHMLTHGTSIYPNLLTNETATELRDWIARENHIREGWSVIENQNRFTWGIDINMHPKLQTFWQELASNKQLLEGLEAIVGPDPAVIEFTAITSSYGAEDQYMHADLIPGGSPTKYARSFVPSYSLFVPLQDTTYGMGATHVCPGTHLCSEADDVCAEHGAFAVSGETGVWKMGNGALVNQQTFHRGMGFTEKGAPDRVVLIATFASRPIYRTGMETRQIGQGGSYSLLWNQWGHTFYDYVHADKRMTEPQKTLRSLGIIKGNGWNYLSSLSMRMANEDTDMKEEHLEEFLEEEGGFKFLPMSWQKQGLNEESDISSWHAFALALLKRIKSELRKLYFIGLGVYVAVFYFLVKAQRSLGIGGSNKQSTFAIGLRFVGRILATHGVVVGIAWLALNSVEDTPWAKAIKSRKLYRIPVTEINDPAPSTIPNTGDILFVPHFSSDYLASYARVIDYAHPGNLYWKRVAFAYAPSYNDLSPKMKDLFCSTLIFETTRDRRFLKQDEERFWTEVLDENELLTACHRELTLAFDPLLETLSDQIVSLRTETEFGKFRGTAMQAKTMTDYLQSWDNRVFANSSQETPSSESFLKRPEHTRKSQAFARAIHSQTRLESLGRSSTPLRKAGLPPQPPREEPFYGAWLKEGDRVEGKFACKEDGLWFPGTITAAIPGMGAYDVLYDDGDTDKELPEECVDRLVPYNEHS